MHKLFLVSGHSGAGKTEIMRTLMDSEILSFTTREKREHEVNGRDYIFITKEEFNELLKNDGLAEHVEYDGNFYGITKKELDTKLTNDHSFAVVDFNGMQQLKELYPNSITIFIYASRIDAYENMLSRGDNEENILRRMSTYDEEIGNKGHYDYVVKNIRGKLDYTIDIVKNILEAECSL